MIAWSPCLHYLCKICQETGCVVCGQLLGSGGDSDTTNEVASWKLRGLI